MFDALMHDNTISPIGRALWIWNHFVGDEMVATTSSDDVRLFASPRRGEELALFLLNKSRSAREVAVVLQRPPRPLAKGERWGFRGDGPSDRNPVWTPAGPVDITESRVIVRLDPVSITVILLKPALPATEPARPGPPTE